MKGAKLLIFLFFVGCIFLNLPVNGQPLGLKFKSVIFESEFINPIHVVSSPDTNDERLFIVFQDGKVKIFENDELLAEPFLDISSTGMDLTDYGQGSEQGMLSMAFDPDYKTNGFIYVTYSGLSTDKKSLFDWHLASFKLSENDPNKIDITTFKKLLEVREPQRGHNAGQLHFGPDGYLYVTLGDGGATGNGGDDHGPIGNAQNKKTLMGKMLRLDVNGTEDYKIPPTNPFVGDTSALDEIWAYGFRNPWKFSFDRETHDIYISDVGDLAWEEVSFQPANSTGGENYGWRIKEGAHCNKPSENCDTTPMVDPIFEYQHSPHEEKWLCAVIGGYVYRGSAITALDGYYLFADACTQQFWYLKRDSMNQWQGDYVKAEFDVEQDKYKDNVTAFGEDNKGEHYVCTRRGVYKLTEATFDIGQLPDDFFEFNAYPNPTKDFINIEVYNFGNTLNYNLTIFNNVGKIVKDLSVSQSVKNYKISVVELDPGIYHAVIKIHDRPLVLRKKFVIIK